MNKYNFKEKNDKHDSSLMEKIQEKVVFGPYLNKNARSLVFNDQIMGIVQITKKKGGI